MDFYCKLDRTVDKAFQGKLLGFGNTTCINGGSLKLPFTISFSFNYYDNYVS